MSSWWCSFGNVFCFFASGRGWKFNDKAGRLKMLKLGSWIWGPFKICVLASRKTKPWIPWMQHQKNGVRVWSQEVYHFSRDDPPGCELVQRDKREAWTVIHWTYKSPKCHPKYLYIYLFVCLSVCLSICLSVYLSICLSVSLSLCLSVSLSLCLSVYLSICLSIYLSIDLSIYLPIYLSICLSIYLSICLSIYLSIYLSICLLSSFREHHQHIIMFEYTTSWTQPFFKKGDIFIYTHDYTRVYILCI